MAGASATWHEPYDKLQPKTRAMHRALVSLMEELEAIDWYAQRVEVSDDATLAEILAHNGNEEREHAAMLLEWIRRHDPVFERHLRTYLFKGGDIVEREAQEEAGGERGPAGGGSAPRASVGSLKEPRR